MSQNTDLTHYYTRPQVDAKIAAAETAGPPGTNGTNGNTVLNGSGAPGSGVGVNGDFYLDTVAEKIYGPKAAGVWPSVGVSLVGPAGSNGTPGTNGNTVLNGSGAPGSGTGSNGDFYIDVVAEKIYGPKATGTWPSVGVSLVGPAGSNGTNGTNGTNGAPAPLSIGFIINVGTPGTNVGPMLPATRVAGFTKCVVTVKFADATTGLTFRIKQNGTTIFTVNPTVAAGTAPGTVSTFTALTSSPLTVAANDLFTIDILSGTANWQFTAVME